MSGVSHGIIVAGGIGSRMLPSSAYLPKEMLPLIDVPVLIHLILEAKSAGITTLHIVTSPSKNLDVFDQAQFFHQYRKELDAQLFFPLDGLDIQFHIQPIAKGFGDALMQALPHVEGPCLVLLGDNILLDRHSDVEHFAPSQVSTSLVDAFNRTLEPTVGLCEVSFKDVEHYGIAQFEDRTIVDIVEKPKPEDAPSKFALCGRYVFTEDTLNLLQRYSYELHGELQTIELQKHWMREHRLHGHVFENIVWYDSGLPLSWLKAQIDHGLRREDYRDELRSWLASRLD